jgi:hypothetical protein
MVSLANELKDGAIAWLREIHPELLEG